MPTVLPAVTLFAAAALVMTAQPLAGKVLLPLAGGTPAVWTTCLVFFQAALLAAYAYADRLTRLAPRRQLLVHALVLAAGAAAGVWLHAAADPAWVPADRDNPVAGLTLYLAALVGGPFFALAATAPVVQHWLAAGQPGLKNPYVLYAASNAGSLAGLVSYPFLIEPTLALGDQERLWAGGFAVVAGLILVCGLTFRPRPGDPRPAVEPTPPPSRRIRLKWLSLAALPASLLAGVTAHLSTDVAPVPLVWVGPLALYLLSFVVVFAWWPARAARVAGRLLPMGLVFLTVALVTRAAEPMGLVAALHLGVFFLAALVCHGELARSRPPAAHLTGFYLTLSLGGVLGGLFNALVAPILFSGVGMAEYPLAVALVALVRPGRVAPPTRRDALICLGFALLTTALVVGVGRAWPAPAGVDAADELVGRVIRGGLLVGLPAAVAFALVARPALFAACLGTVLAVGSLDPGPHGSVLLITRNFFGTLRVTQSPDGRFVRLVHGTTQHGQQRTDEAARPTPLMYYHETGPAGRLLAGLPAPRNVAAVGLGCGALAAYARPGDAWTFYEIDPAVVRVARESGHFTYLATADAPIDIVLGDARRQLALAPDGSFDLIVLDAFSSDAVPVHLLTAEAFALYARKLTPAGVLLFHLSNRYLDLVPVVARTAAAHDPPFAVWADDDMPTDAQKEAGKAASVWAAAARTRADLGAGAADARWQTPRVPPGAAWRDDFADLPSAWKRGE